MRTKDSTGLTARPESAGQHCDSVLLVATILGWSVALDAIAYRCSRVVPLIRRAPGR